MPKKTEILLDLRIASWPFIYFRFLSESYFVSANQSRVALAAPTNVPLMKICDAFAELAKKLPVYLYDVVASVKLIAPAEVQVPETESMVPPAV